MNLAMFFRFPSRAALLVVLSLCAAVGCRKMAWDHATDIRLDHYEMLSSSTEYSNEVEEVVNEEISAYGPRALDNPSQAATWELTLQECMQMAFSNNRVLRNLRGALLQSPENVDTILDPAIIETNPRFGVESALSEFDAQFAMLTSFQNNDRALNNRIAGGGAEILQQDFHQYGLELSKQAATGTQYSLRNQTVYDANNRIGNRFPSYWGTQVEAEFRHPLLQGSSVSFNRIAGPKALPGQIQGVLIARINTDISVEDFRVGLRDYASNVENAYWDLYFAYRDLDAKIKARDAALETWRRIHALYVAGRPGGEAQKEAQAREQYFSFEQEVENALNGRVLDGTRTFNGSTGGSFRGIGGVYTNERRLRLLLGLPINDGRLIRPMDEPPAASVTFDWAEALGEAFVQRTELRRQRLKIRRREMEIKANRNFLYPRFDVVGQYRFRGFGDDLIDPNGGVMRFDNAVEDLTTGDFQEWELGLQLEVPIGYRLAHSAVRNAELLLARERSVLKEQRRQVVHDLSNAIADMQRAYQSSRTSFNRYSAAQQQLEAAQSAFDADQASLELVLDAQRRLADAESRHYRALIEHAVALKNVHFEKGSLLQYDGIHLSEGATTRQAQIDAAELRCSRAPKFLNYILNR